MFGNKLKEYLYDNIDKKLKWQLLLRVTLGVLLLVSIYTSVKSLPLVLVGVVTNLSPLLTAVLSFFILKKALTTVDAVALVASFIGVVLLRNSTRRDSHQQKWGKHGDPNHSSSISANHSISSSSTLETTQKIEWILSNMLYCSRYVYRIWYRCRHFRWRPLVTLELHNNWLGCGYWSWILEYLCPILY